ncbi:hypothetical protein BJ875DRAFT_452702 [Amylocarpus encephaloides]|uniref:Uncharacterized protein n=1 Tax=Amylocarpus encephaloides TaxID=45428 RepID=A0A9P7YQ40_9HELO|nr:hypothetical protein BJ875DRAFT_452702 [Amylocarpus encephaloides]
MSSYSSAPPVLEVSHLPSAASYYAAITQPLGLQYLFASAPSAPSAAVHFGTVAEIGDGVLPAKIVFSVCQSATPSPRLSQISLDAPSPKAVIDFHKQSESLNQTYRHHTLQHKSAQGLEDLVASTADFDGNMVQASYASHGPPRVGAPSSLETASTEKEAKRVLEWQEDVARSVSGAGEDQSRVSTSTYREPGAGPGTFRRAETFPAPSGRGIERHITTSERYRGTHAPRPRPAEPERSTSGGMSTKAIIGTFLGAAAGACVAYAMVRSESPEPAASAAAAPPAVPAPPTRSVSYVGGGASRGPASTYSHRIEHNMVERIPARTLLSGRSDTQDVRPRYVAQYTAVGSHVRGLERIDEGSYISQTPSRSQRSHAQSSRARSKSRGHGSRYEQRPLEIMPPSSHVSSSHRSHKSGASRHHEKASTTVSSSSTHREDASYHSARSGSTVKPSGGGSKVSSHHVSAKSKSGSPSKAGSATTTIKLEAGSKGGAKGASHVELPRSMASGVGYAESVAPSDSVSSIGSKMERLRLVERMSRG